MIKVMRKKSFTVHWILLYVGKTFAVLLSTRTKTTFYAYNGTQNGSYKISWENFMVCKSAKPYKFCSI